MHHIDRVVFTFCCFILFVAVCTALYGFWTNPDNLPPALAAAIHATSPPTALAKTTYTEEYRKNTNISTGKKKNKYLSSLPPKFEFHATTLQTVLAKNTNIPSRHLFGPRPRLLREERIVGVFPEQNPNIGIRGTLAATEGN